MGNKASQAFDPNKNGFNKTMDPNQNGVGTAFRKLGDDTKNAFVKMGSDTKAAFQKGGVIPDILHKIEPIANKIGDVYQKVGGGLALAGTALDATGIGAPFGVPLQAIGGAMGLAGGVTKKIGSTSGSLGNTLEKPKKDFNASKDIPAIIYS